MIVTQNGKTFGSQSPIMLVKWDELDQDGKLVDSGIIRCTPEQEAEFLSVTSEEPTSRQMAESWVLANK